MSVGRSFIKGPRFAFKESQTRMACEACCWGRGAHTCEDLCSSCKGTGILAVIIEGTLKCQVCRGTGRLTPAGAAPHPSDPRVTRDGA